MCSSVSVRHYAIIPINSHAWSTSRNPPQAKKKKYVTVMIRLSILPAEKCVSLWAGLKHKPQPCRAPKLENGGGAAYAAPCRVMAAGFMRGCKSVPCEDKLFRPALSFCFPFAWEALLSSPLPLHTQSLKARRKATAEAEAYLHRRPKDKLLG
jgi:hypothetical protein